jgi:hypothetical protein
VFGIVVGKYRGFCKPVAGAADLKEAPNPDKNIRIYLGDKQYDIMGTVARCSRNGKFIVEGGEYVQKKPGWQIVDDQKYNK